MEAGCGIVPITYRDKSYVHALQWAIGLEWYLLMNDPWRIALSTDHPNGAAFVSYPAIIELLMSRDARMAMIEKLPARLRERCTLPELTREYSLQEIAIITRAAPARLLGLRHKGHLGHGADADITIYRNDPDKRRMFELPHMVIKAGRSVIEQGEIREVPFGPAWCVEPPYDPEILNELQPWFDEYYTMSFENYPVEDRYLSHGKRVSVSLDTSDQTHPESRP
jgi:formylmethanofuran dehydrogenase subunit A